ncbi:MAG: hypothetical protein AAF310_00870 [Myxococcota bacterium]
MSEYTTRDDQEEIACDEEIEKPVEQREIDHSHIDLNALWVVRRLHARGYEAYLTGGCVRDLLLGKTPKDFDVATNAKPADIQEVFSNSRLVGRRFLLAHIYFPGGRVIETATFRASPDKNSGDLLVRRDNAYGTLEEDAERRDLTINGLFYDPVSKNLIDFVGGQADLRAGTIRSIGDPDVRMQEDPVRMLRAIKFSCRLGFDIEPATLSAIRNHAADIVRCAPARLQEELLGLLKSKQAKSCMLKCQQLGILDALLPELMEGLSGNLAAEKSEKVETQQEQQEAAATANTQEAETSQKSEGPVSALQRQQHWQAMLHTLDEVCSRGTEVEGTVLFAAMLLPAYNALIKVGRNADSWLEQVCAQWGKRIRLIRRDQDFIRLLLSCVTETFLQQELPENAMKNVVRKSWFVQALLLYILHLHSTGQPLDSVKKWKQVAHQENKPYIQIRKVSSRANTRAS